MHLLSQVTIFPGLQAVDSSSVPQDKAGSEVHENVIFHTS